MIGFPYLFNSSRARACVLLVGVSIASSFLAMPEQPRFSILAEANGCSVNVNNLHVSTGAGGVISKGFWSCERVPTDIILDTSQLDGCTQWVCPTDNNGAKDEDWISSHCTNKGATYVDFTIYTAFKSYTRYTPPSGQPGAHGSGHWISCAQWHSNGPNGPSSQHTNFSNWVQINYPAPKA